MRILTLTALLALNSLANANTDGADPMQTDVFITGGGGVVTEDLTVSLSETAPITPDASLSANTTAAPDTARVDGQFFFDQSASPATGSAPSTPTTSGEEETGFVMIDPATLARQRALETLRDQCAQHPNWSFENGLDCWEVDGDAFAGQPARGDVLLTEDQRPQMALQRGGIGGDYWQGIPYPLDRDGEGWIAGFEDPGSGIGTLTSAPFSLTQRYVSWVQGGGTTKVWVELQIRASSLKERGITPSSKPDNDGFVLVAMVQNRIQEEDLKRVWVDVLQLFPQLADRTTPSGTLPALEARLRIVDRLAQPHINVDDFRFTGSDPRQETITVQRQGVSLRFDADAPVWGFADTHARPAHHLAFGGRLHLGDPMNPLSEGAGGEPCSPGNPLHMGLLDPEWRSGPAGSCANTTVGSLQQHISFLQRAYQGGQRLMVAVAVNNQYFANHAQGLDPQSGYKTDDHSAAMAQLAYIRHMASKTPWMEVATSPAEARRIILEDKMAIVMGLEIDNFGNFKDQDYVWRDPSPNDSAPLVTLDRDPTRASQQLEQVIQTYRNAGVRQITPIHAVNNLFGGVAIQQNAMTLHNHGVTGSFGQYAVQTGAPDGVAYHINDDIASLQQMTPALGARGVQDAVSLTNAYAKQNLSALQSTVNGTGLTPRGAALIAGLMREGMIVDAENMSYKTKDDLFSLASRYQYPIVSSHTDVAALSMRSPGQAWGGLDDAGREALFGTTNIGNLAHEGQMLDRHLAQIRDTGGTLGMIMSPHRKQSYSGGGVVNNLDGSSKTWAQTYLHAIDRMRDVNGDVRGIGLATDNGLVASIGPRFGPSAGLPLARESRASLHTDARTAQRYAQGKNHDKGVKYDIGLQDASPERFARGLSGVNGEDLTEEDIWKALAFIAVNPTVNPAAPAYRGPNVPKVSLSNQALHGERIERFVRGWHAPSEMALTRPDGTDRAWEEAVFYLIRHNLSPCDLTVQDAQHPNAAYSSDDLRMCSMPTDPNAGPLPRMYAKVKPVYDLWQNMAGNNAPLRRLVTHGRDWDINLDGVAHYGMLPDFLQDLRNIGVTPAQMSVLFRSAEDYIRTWERAEAAGKNVPNKVP